MKNPLHVRQFKDFRLVWTFENKTPELRAALVDFWLRNGAIEDPCEAWRRSFEVGCIAFNALGEIVGISSFYVDRLIQDGQVYWIYRTFVRPASRVPGLAPQIFDLTFDKLAELHAAEPHSPVGIIGVIENPKLEKAGGVRLIQRAGWERLGSDEQGKSVWRKCFKANAARTGEK